MAIGTIITLIIFGIALLLLELILPGGIVGTLGAILIMIAVIGGFMNDSALGSWLLIGSIVGGLAGFYLWVHYFPDSRMGKKIILQDGGKEWRGYDERKKDLIGMRGVVKSSLHPGGVVLVNGKRTDVVTRGEMIETDAEVEVIDVEGNRIVVAAVRDQKSNEVT